MEVGGSNNDDNDNTLKRLRLLWVGWGFFEDPPPRTNDRFVILSDLVFSFFFVGLALASMF